MASSNPTRRRPPPPLDAARLNEMALAYVARFATSRAKLMTYLTRKLRERGWNGDTPPEPDAIADRLARLGYIDDAAFAFMKSRGLVARGYGQRRVGEALRGAGISDADAAAALDHAGRQAAASAIHFARRRRLGPFAEVLAEGPARDKAIGAFLRAGHRFGLARAIVQMAPGATIDEALLAEIA